jgi:hypothetical protein
MKALSIFLTIALMAAIGYIIYTSKQDAHASSARGQLAERHSGHLGAPSPEEQQIASLESQIVTEQASKRNPVPPPPIPPPAAVPAPLPPRPVPAPAVASLPAPTPMPPTPGPSPRLPVTPENNPALSAALESADASPLALTPRQRLIAASPRLAEVKHYEKEHGLVEITAGKARKIENGMGFAIRLGHAIIARVKVVDVDTETSVAEVSASSLPPGVIIEVGDEVIQDLPPGA